MALETLKTVKEINSFKVMTEKDRVINPETNKIDWEATDEKRKEYPIAIDFDKNMISFRIQKGAIKKNGVNGCQIDTMIEATRLIIEQLNGMYPCLENENCLFHLEQALKSLVERKKDRIERGVEGKDEI